MAHFRLQNGMNEIGPLLNGAGYITEKLYMLLQLYLQNKGWSPSIELLQCFTELKESSMLPSAGHLQMLASRVTLDSAGRLVLRENGKIVLPFEHFANAVMLKHMNGPHGLHLSLDATIRAVIESYSIGRDNFGMEKEFISEVVQSCPSPACRFYKSQLDLSQAHNKPTYIPDIPSPISCSNMINVPASPGIFTSASNSIPNETTMSTSMAPPLQPPPTNPTPTRSPSRPPSVDLPAVFDSLSNNKLPHSNSESPTFANSMPVPPPSPKPLPKMLSSRQQQQNKLADFLKANLENFDGLTTGSKDNIIDLNWHDDTKKQDAGQEKIIRTFSEIMKNMNRMKSCVRPAMCKPYGKQSEALQKTVIDTIQLVQSLRSFLPPSHITVNSWKNDDKHPNRNDRKMNSVGQNIPNASPATNSNMLSTSSLSTVNVDETNEPNRNNKIPS